jgi:hypothetical protein
MKSYLLWVGALIALAGGSWLSVGWWTFSKAWRVADVIDTGAGIHRFLSGRRRQPTDREKVRKRSHKVAWTAAILVLTTMLAVAKPVTQPYIFGALGAVFDHWKALGVVLVGYWILDAWASFRRFLAGEPCTPAGFLRAAESFVMRTAFTDALRHHFGDVASPARVADWSRATTTALGDGVQEYGWRVTVTPPIGKTERYSVDSFRTFAGGGLGPDTTDSLAFVIGRSIYDDASKLARYVKKRLPGDRLTVLNTSFEPARTDGQVDVRFAVLTLCTIDPMSSTILYPYAANEFHPGSGRGDRRVWADPIPVGPTRNGTIGYLRIDQDPTIVQGSRGAGKSSLLGVILAAVAYVQHVAIIAIDYKGGAELGPWGPRCSIVLTDPDEGVLAQRWMERIARRRAAEDRTTAVTAANPAVLLIVDEAHQQGELTAIEREKATSESLLAVAERHARRRMSALEPLVKLGRSGQCITILASQYVKSTTMNTDITSQLQRFAGRLQDLSESQVAVKKGVSRYRGPHMIPSDREWNGIIFGAFVLGYDYVRTWFVTEAKATEIAAATARLRVGEEHPDIAELIKIITDHRAAKAAGTATDVTDGLTESDTPLVPVHANVVVLEELDLELQEAIIAAYDMSRGPGRRPYAMPKPNREGRTILYRNSLLAVIDQALPEAPESLATTLDMILVAIQEQHPALTPSAT